MKTFSYGTAVKLNARKKEEDRKRGGLMSSPTGWTKLRDFAQSHIHQWGKTYTVCPENKETKMFFW